MEIKLPKLNSFKMMFTLTDFLKKYDIKDDTMTESDLQKSFEFSIYPRDLIISIDNGFVIIDDSSMEGFIGHVFTEEIMPSHVCCAKESYYFDSFGGPADDLFQQLPKPITQNYKLQDIVSKFCDVYCFYFFYLIEGMDYKNAVSKIFFG